MWLSLSRGRNFCQKACKTDRASSSLLRSAIQRLIHPLRQLNNRYLSSGAAAKGVSRSCGMIHTLARTLVCAVLGAILAPARALPLTYRECPSLLSRGALAVLPWLPVPACLLWTAPE